ncbi:MAG: response regulator [Deltaproteobacteria bacterium]|nr:response regulator [Deltaproteobacteria bacterium]
MSKTILIADDSPTELRIFQKVLSTLGHRILTAVDGEEAERMVRLEPPDLLILDVIMPGKNGFALCRDLKRDPTYASIPIIIVTSKDQQADQIWGKRQGADEYLVKPFSPEDLAAAAARLLGTER